MWYLFITLFYIHLNNSQFEHNFHILDHLKMISVNWFFILFFLLSFYSHLDKFSVSCVYYRNNPLSVFSSAHIFFKTYYTFLILLSFATNIYAISLIASGFSVLVKKVMLAANYCTCNFSDFCKNVTILPFTNKCLIHLKFGIRSKWIADCASANT